MCKLVVLFMLISITGFSQISEWNNPKKHPYSINTWYVDTLNGRPINFFLNNPKIDKYSKMYYKGEFAASDDELTFAFLDSVVTTNPDTRDFYLFIFNSVLRITDGALSEYIGKDCRAYFEKYPCDFLKLKNAKLYSDNYQRWISFAAFEYMMENDPIKAIGEKIELARPFVAVNCNEFKNEKCANFPG